MEHKGTARIETERLLLRRFTVEDAPAAFRNWTSDGEVTKFLTWPTHRDVQVTERVLAGWVAGYENTSFYQWAIHLKALGEPIGSISAVHLDEALDIAHIGYCIGKAWWGRGIVCEAFSAIIPFFFDEVGVNRIEARHDANNPNSGRVMRKCGLVYEGTLRQADTNNQGVVDAVYYSLLKREYRAGVVTAEKT